MIRARIRRWRWARVQFVRTHLQAAGGVSLPEAGGDRLRVLLVICRPGGREDVPFRSVASRLVRGGAEQMHGLDLDVLRPSTFPRLAQVLHEATDAGRPYHVVHFDGHGTYLDLSHTRRRRRKRGRGRRGTARQRPASGGGGKVVGWGCRRCGMGSRWRGRCGRASMGT